MQKEIDAARNGYTDVRTLHADLHLVGGRQRECERRMASASWAWPAVRLRRVAPAIRGDRRAL